ncbi:rhodanese-like domain-containing protein [Snodgrassella communis]|jgi:rhodanese-related sulfurtransferase|uniref:rhodanese-like domain-containing protein n=1 Tax=Snodgrassella communis TaxID=2946699 RepID=UPI001EF74371|nr:rhodanese-like domain-containing protein [Snodgrassella communis]
MTIQTLSATQLQQWQQQNQNFILLDVREDNEVQYAAIPGHHHIPMNMIPLRQNELPDDKPIVLYCHHGMRSMQVALYLQETGFDNLYNLHGGIDAWSREVDASVPTY